ncbi:unnamed protein product [Timema podura]|uniref:Uncharacterized protein n=1 Tax=Timema podura TaxID=61482 RepID=A0ABN7PHE7_TIMPD|nr:unnamed protein product [Timema podura]
MAATSMRLPSKHQTPLKTLNRGNNFLRSHRPSNTPYRDSNPEPLVQ